MNKYVTLAKNHTGELIEKLLTHVLSQNPVEVLFNCEDDDQWSIISIHQYEEDVEISLRLHAADVYDLYIGYYDDEDEFFEIVQPLTDDEKSMIPPKLQMIMKKVLEDEKGLRFPGSAIGS